MRLALFASVAMTLWLGPQPTARVEAEELAFLCRRPFFRSRAPICAPPKAVPEINIEIPEIDGSHPLESTGPKVFKSNGEVNGFGVMTPPKLMSYMYSVNPPLSMWTGVAGQQPSSGEDSPWWFRYTETASFPFAFDTWYIAVVSTMTPPMVTSQRKFKLESRGGPKIGTSHRDHIQPHKDGIVVIEPDNNDEGTQGQTLPAFGRLRFGFKDHTVVGFLYNKHEDNPRVLQARRVQVGLFEDWRLEFDIPADLPTDGRYTIRVVSLFDPTVRPVERYPIWINPRKQK